jgi:hypothetical protein
LKFVSAVAAGLMVGALGIAVAAPAQATVFTFDTDPLIATVSGTPSAIPGDGLRQVVNNNINANVEPRITFNTAADHFSFSQMFFHPNNNTLGFFNGHVSGPADDSLNGLNVIVLQDGQAAAGAAANLIANHITQDGAGFFVYFNTTLHAPRLVYSTNLNFANGDNVPDGDLSILARMTNLDGFPTGITAQDQATQDQAAIRAFADFTADNFAMVPEPSIVSLLGAGLAVGAPFARRRRAKAAHANI